MTRATVWTPIGSGYGRARLGGAQVGPVAAVCKAGGRPPGGAHLDRGETCRGGGGEQDLVGLGCGQRGQGEAIGEGADLGPALRTGHAAAGRLVTGVRLVLMPVAHVLVPQRQRAASALVPSGAGGHLGELPANRSGQLRAGRQGEVRAVGR